MKKISVLMAAFFVACMSAFADNVISITPSPVQVSPGDEVTLEIEFDNTNGLCKGFQMDLKMPEGFEIATKEQYDEDEEEYVTVTMVEKGTLLKSGHTIQYSELEPGSYRFICVDMGNATLRSKAGTVMALTFVADKNLSAGEFDGLVSAIEFNTKDDTALKFDDISFKVVIVPTKINGVSADKQMKSVYNISGQQINGAQKGINIVDGKKVMVK